LEIVVGDVCDYHLWTCLESYPDILTRVTFVTEFWVMLQLWDPHLIAAVLSSIDVGW